MRIVDTGRLIDEGSLNRLSVTLLILAFLTIFLDGFDLFALSYAAPHILSEWAITNKAVMAPVFSASLVGMLIGAPLCGLLADRIGRKILVVVCCALIGLTTLLAVLTANLPQLLATRAIAGLGFGGIAPCLIALTAEYAPTRYRATMITVMYTGITAGAAAAGAVGAWLVPGHGWRILFELGGLGALVMTIACVIALPESLRFLVSHRASPARILRLVRRFDPTIPDDAIFPAPAVPAGPALARRFAVRQLFAGTLALLTPLMWTINVSIVMAYYAVSTWLPTLLSTLHRPASSAAAFAMIFQVGGALGGIALSRRIDKGHMTAIAWAFAVAMPLVLLISVTATFDAALFATVFLAGFSIMSVQFGINAIVAMAYPTSIRSLALGWSFAISRIGAISGPLLVGAALEFGLAAQNSFAVACLPLLTGLVASVVLARVWKAPEAPTHAELLPGQAAQ